MGISTTSVCKTLLFASTIGMATQAHAADVDARLIEAARAQQDDEENGEFHESLP